MDATRTFSAQPASAEDLRRRIAQQRAQNREPAGTRPSPTQGPKPVRPSPAGTVPVGPKTPETVRKPAAPAAKAPAGAVTPAKPSGAVPARQNPVPAASPAVGKPVPVRQNSSLTERAVQSAERTVKEVQPVRPKPVPAVKPADNSAMNRTRTAEPVREKKEKYDGYAGSDEGGNTVVSIVKAIVYIVFVMIVSVFLALVAINVGNDMFAFVKSDELVEVNIPEYATLDEVTEVLFRNDIIRYPTVFKLFAVAEEDDRKFVAGSYTVNGMMSYEALLDAFKEKPVVGIKKITIPEGYTTDEIIDLFVSEGIGTREGFVDVIQNYEFDYWFIRELNEKGVHEDRIYRLDGYLFPDTYEFYLNSSEAAVVDKLLKRFSQIFTKEYREQSAAFGYTVDQVVTLASIIEKEAASPSEFFTISSVFHNRLNNPWTFPKLESDATIVYQMQHETGERPQLTGADLEVDLAYNTYTNDGLPPGPIANPSASAMLAALSPVTTNYYFFYHHKGILYPSETKAQHDAIVAQFKSYTEEQTTGDLVTE